MHSKVENREIRYKIRYRKKDDRNFFQKECGHQQMVMKLTFGSKSMMALEGLLLDNLQEPPSCL